MGSSRNNAFIIVFIFALLGGVFVYRKESALVGTKTTPSIQTGTIGQNQIKGSVINAHLNSSSSQSVDSYLDSDVAAHRPITNENIIWFTNYERVKNGVAPLVESNTLDLSAKLKDEDMITYQYFDHTRPGGHVTFDHFFDQAHYAFIKAGENLAQGTFVSTDQLLSDWMNSPEHRKNILDPAYTQIGVAAEDTIFKGFETTLAVQHFGEPRKNCPTVDNALGSDLRQLQGQAQQLNQNIASAQKSVDAATSSDSEYQQLVDDYNNLANNYNQVVAEIRTLGNQYNAQVGAFNACVGQQ